MSRRKTIGVEAALRLTDAWRNSASTNEESEIFHSTGLSDLGHGYACGVLKYAPTTEECDKMYDLLSAIARLDKYGISAGSCQAVLDAAEKIIALDQLHEFV